MKTWVLEVLTSAEKMQQQREEMKMFKQWEAENVDKEATRIEMGKWLADYLDDAGYDNWASYPSIYKTMFINAFPPIDPLDDKAVDADTVDLENLMLGFLNVADSHLKHSEKPLLSKITPRGLFAGRAGLV